MLGALTTSAGFDPFGSVELVAPPLLWPEVRSALHVASVRAVISREAADRALRGFDSAPVRARSHGQLGTRAWRIADELGWAKTYDAEYLALSELLRAPLVTFDARVRRAAERLGVLASISL